MSKHQLNKEQRESNQGGKPFFPHGRERSSAAASSTALTRLPWHRFGVPLARRFLSFVRSFDCMSVMVMLPPYMCLSAKFGPIKARGSSEWLSCAGNLDNHLKKKENLIEQSSYPSHSHCIRAHLKTPRSTLEFSLGKSQAARLVPCYARSMTIGQSFSRCSPQRKTLCLLFKKNYCACLYCVLTKIFSLLGSCPTSTGSR